MSQPRDLQSSSPRAGVVRALLALALAPAVALGPASPASAAIPTPPLPPLPSGVEDLQPYVGQEGCDPVAKPGVLAFQALLMKTYRDTGTSGISRDCGVGGQSEHKEGRAFDWTVSVNNPNQVAEVEALTDWLTAWDGPDFAANARRFGIMYMIWDRHVWKAYQPTLGWQDYTGSDPHTSHVHFSFGWNGALKQTSWWTGQVAPLSYGPYSTSRPSPPTPPTGPGPSAPPVPQASAIARRYGELGGAGGLLGPATGPEADVAGGRWQPYRSGALYWSAATGVHEVHGAVLAVYLAGGGPAGPAGFPVTDELGTADKIGRYNHFSGATSIYWSPATGAHRVQGAIRAAWAASGWEMGPLGYPTTDEMTTPDKAGRYTHFSKDGSVYWSLATGAHRVQGAIRAAWAASGWEMGPLGYPTTDEVTAPDKVGRYTHFSKDASVYWSPASGAHVVQGAIRREWAATGWESGPLGYPTTDELMTPDRIGRFNHFSKGGSVYWTLGTGAHEVHGAIRAEWAANGWEAGPLGYPTTDELMAPDRVGRFGHFSKAGSVYWSPATGAHEVHGAIRDAWAADGWENGPAGYPTSDSYGPSSRRSQDFQRRAYDWDTVSGAVTSRPR